MTISNIPVNLELTRMCSSIGDMPSGARPRLSRTRMNLSVASTSTRTISSTIPENLVPSLHVSSSRNSSRCSSMNVTAQSR